jgi:dihydrofolate reductase
MRQVLGKDAPMSKLVVTEFISADGVIDSPGGETGYKHTGWTFDIEPDPTVYEFKGWELDQAETQLLGRRTYEGFAAAWPERGGDGGFADRMNAMEKYVVSTTLTDPTWENTTVISSDVAAKVAELRAREGGDILVAGSATLVRFLHEKGLVDEYHLMVFPVVLGSGKRLFPDDAADKVKLSLEDTKAFSNGIILNTYTVAG